MTIEITSATMQHGIITITGIDVSEENLQRMERIRDDGFERELAFLFDTKEKKAVEYIYKWLKRRKSKEAATWGEAVSSTVGRITTISARYRVYDD